MWRSNRLLLQSFEWVHRALFNAVLNDPVQSQSILTFVGLFAEPLIKLRTSSVNGRTRSILITCEGQKVLAVSGRQLARWDSSCLTARVRITESAMKMATPTKTTSTL